MSQPPASTPDLVVEWVRSHAIPLAGTEPRQGWADLEPLRPIIGDARIVSLGEATHGTREFFRLKHRLLEFCVAELGFTTFIMEAPFSESLGVNAYVLAGTGDAADALAGMRFWVWNTEEVLDLIEWMRWWNRTHRQQVTFYGYTMVDATVAVHGLIGFLARVAPELAAACGTELATLSCDATADLFPQLPDDRRDAALAFISHVLGEFAGRRAAWTARTSAVDWHLGRLHAVVLDQAARFALHRSFSFYERAVADNVRALLDADGPDARAVLWSHNGHAARIETSEDGTSMGMELDRMVGRAQVVIGFSFDRGSFQARDFPTGRLTDHGVDAAPPDTFDGVLAAAGLPLFALDLAHGPREGPAAAWLSSETTMRSIGGIYGIPPDHELGVRYAVPITPRAAFDAMMFVAETTPARRNQPLHAAPNLIALPEPSNLNLVGDGVPADWHWVNATRRHSGAVGVSGDASPSGGHAVRLSRDAPWRWGHVELIQKISAGDCRGMRLIFSAAARTLATDVGSGALLSVRFMGKPTGDRSDFLVAPLATSLSGPSPARSQHWTTLTVEADVPDAADCFVIGLVLTGNGTAWFGDLAVDHVRQTSRGTARLPRR